MRRLRGHGHALEERVRVTGEGVDQVEAPAPALVRVAPRLLLRADLVVDPRLAPSPRCVDGRGSGLRHHQDV